MCRRNIQELFIDFKKNLAIKENTKLQITNKSPNLKFQITNKKQ